VLTIFLIFLVKSNRFGFRISGCIIIWDGRRRGVQFSLHWLITIFYDKCTSTITSQCRKYSCQFGPLSSEFGPLSSDKSTFGSYSPAYHPTMFLHIS
jgi:hypothetical protein